MRRNHLRSFEQNIMKGRSFFWSTSTPKINLPHPGSPKRSAPMSSFAQKLHYNEPSRTSNTIRSMKTKIFISALIPVTLAVTLWTCSKQEETKETSAIPVDESAIAVSLTAVKSGDYSLPVNSSGLINTETESRLSF